MNWSKYQEGVFDFASNGTGHGTVSAVAGSGKTTTGVQMVQRLNPMDQVLFTSFTNVIVKTTAEKLKEAKIRNVRAQGYNSFGYSLVTKNMRPVPKLLTDPITQKTDIILTYDVLRNEESNRQTYFAVRQSVFRVVDILKSLCIVSVDDANNQLDDIFDYYDIDIPKDPRFRDILLEVYGRCLKRTDIMDFNDQKLFPILFNWQVPQYDVVVIDEYQDTCPVESELMTRASKYGRIIVFGDPYQAIYSFKGTKPNSMQEFTTKYNASELPLSICYRCPRSVVEEAKTIVPHIEWAPDAIDGAVDTVKKAAFLARCTNRDMVLSRCTQDLVKSALDFIRQGRAAYVEGREYGNQLKWFIDKLLGRDNDYLAADTFMDRVHEHFNEIHPELLKYGREAAAIQLESRVECVEALIIGCRTVKDLKDKISSMFTDNGNGIRHMTIHKSKGLEGNKDGDVWILRPDKLPHPRAKKEHMREEERRLKYVAITRSRRGLFYVEPEKDER